MMRFLVGCLLIALLFLFAGVAHSQQTPPQLQCGPALGLLAQLATKWKERPMFIGVSKDGKSTTRIYANPETLTWTVLALFQDGTACVLASGEGIVLAKPQAEGTPL